MMAAAAAGAASSSASGSSSGLAGGRAPRRTAGNRLSGLLEAEEEDEFYQTTYGGFTEVGGEGPRGRGQDGGGGACAGLAGMKEGAGLRILPGPASPTGRPSPPGLIPGPHINITRGMEELSVLLKSSDLHFFFLNKSTW